MHSTTFRRSLQVMGMLTALAALVGCGTTQRPAPELPQYKESPVMPGSSSRNNTTPMESAFACFSQAYGVVKAPVVSITVGDVKDYTGKFSQAEGNAITQGGSLMLYSALGKMGNAVRLQERFDTRIAELELAYADRRQLGDGQLHAVEAGKPQVPWVPYFGGSILRSDYYIVGGITEVNYNIQSRGAEFNVSSIGGKARTFTMNVGVDLRIVDSRSLLVVKTISMQKQITGTEVGAGIFRFFGTELLDVNMGSKNQEPLQLGVRTTIEHGLLELLGAVSGMSPQPCVNYALKGPSTEEKMLAAVEATTLPVLQARALLPPPKAEPPVMQPQAAAPAKEKAQEQPLPEPVNAVQAVGKIISNSVMTVSFEPNKVELDSTALRSIAEIGATLASNKQKTLKLELLTRETENLPATQRRQLAQDRIKVITDVLIASGVPSIRIQVESLPDASSAMQRQGAGMQLVARLRVVKAKSGTE